MTYVRSLEEVIIRTLHDYGIESGLECGLTGVWVGNDKIAAIGVRVSRPGGAGAAWVTTHGLALNVDVDLAWFERIVPCGIADRGVTSIERLLGDAPALPEVAERLVAHFGEVFGREMRARRTRPRPAAAQVAPVSTSLPETERQPGEAAALTSTGFFRTAGLTGQRVEVSKLATSVVRTSTAFGAHASIWLSVPSRRSGRRLLEKLRRRSSRPRMPSSKSGIEHGQRP